MHTRIRLLAVPLAAVLLAACGAGSTPAPSIGPAASAVSPSVAPAASSTASVAPASPAAGSPAAAAVSASCAKGQVQTLTSGKLTIGTDNPAYPPYFAPSSPDPSPWQLGDPTNQQGFESAVAYAVATQLGFTADQVKWIVVPFENSFQPGAKPFDFYIAQVSYTDARAKAVDLSDGYYFVAQSVVALNGNPLAKVTSISAMKNFKFGAQVGTTAYDAIKNTIAPSTPISVYQTNDAAIKALQAKQIDGLVVDLPTAFYITAAQLVDKNGNSLATIVGQLPVQAGPNAEHFSLVLAKNSPLTDCVNQAISAITANGTLAQITQTWLADKANAPVLQP